MTASILPRNRTIGEIAAKLPGATAVFHKFKLDFCCGGDVLLADAVRERGLDIAAVEDLLAALDQNNAAAAPATTGALIDHIVGRYHKAHRRELPELIRLARKVEAVHAGHPASPLGLADALEAMRFELEEHMWQEEIELFPAMRRGDDSEDLAVVAEMRCAHERHGEHLHGLEAIAGGFVYPADACRSWEVLYVGLTKLVDDVMEHIHLENNVLFPRFEHGLKTAPSRTQAG
jgi:regulator of cell morphogenesis and NO signaling